MNLALDVYTKLEESSLLSQVGKPHTDSFAFKLKVVKDHATAEALFNSDLWADVRTEAQGDLTGYLAKHHYTSYGSYWNHLSKQSRALIEKAISTKLTDALLSHSFPTEMRQSILVDFNRAALELAYRRKFPKGPVFFERSLAIYKAGRLPCGWSGTLNDWPSGVLLVF